MISHSPERPVLLHIFPTFAVGGAQVRFAALANHFGRNMRHIVVALDGKLDARDKLDAGLAIHFADPGRAAGPAAEFRRARRFLRHMHADLLITSNWGAMDWAAANRLTTLPHIHTEDGFGPAEQNRQLTRRVVARRLVLRSSQVVLPSRTLLRIATDQWHLPPANLHFIPNGIDIARFAGAAPATLPPGAGPVVGTIAVLRPEKNVARLLRAFAMLRQRAAARLVIVGDGPERAVLEAQAASLDVGDAVHFAGYSAGAAHWLAAFDLFALSSDTEQMPLSLLEAAAAGLPVASTDVGDVRTMLAAENEPFVVRRDDAALADAMARLLSDPALARAVGAANGARAAAEYDQARMFAAWGRLLSAAIGT